MPKQVEFDSKVSEQIVKLRDTDGEKWGAVSEAVGLPIGKAMLIYSMAKVKPKDRIKNATGADIARLRDEEKLSWGDIIARTGYPEGSCRSLYTEHTGNDTKGNRIGKGGKYPNGEAAPERPAKASGGTAKKATGATKKSAPTKPAADKGARTLDDVADDGVADFITGYALKVDNGTAQPDIIKVASVKKVNRGTIVLTDETGAGRTVKRAAVIQVSKKKVV